MKKFLAMAVVALVGLMATACSTDDAVSDAENYATVSFTVAAPEMATRTLGNGMTARNLSWGVYDADGNYLPKLSSENAEPVVFPAGSLSTTVEIDLVNGKSYHIIFWAEADGSPYKVDFETKQMTYDYNEQKPLLANQEKYDAFFASLPIAQVNGPRREPVELKRPFAQLNIATADTKKAADGGLVVDKTQVEVTTCNTLNLFSGVASGTQTHCYALSELIDDVIKVGSKEYDLLSMNYLLVNGEKELVEVAFTVAEGTSYSRTYNYQSVPLRRNYKTNIIGNLLTSTLDFDITINPIFAEEEYVVRASVEEVLTLGGKFSMTADEVVEVGNAPIVVPEDGLIELNGNTLTFESETEDAVAYVVEDGVTVTFSDEPIETRAGGSKKGKVKSNSKIGSARRGGKIVVEGGHYFTTGSTLFEADGGELHINGGVFEAVNEPLGAIYTLFNNSGSIYVSGGEFWGFNPSAAKGADDNYFNYVKEGYVSHFAGNNSNGMPMYDIVKQYAIENLTVSVAESIEVKWSQIEDAYGVYYIIRYGDKVYGEDKSIVKSEYAIYASELQAGELCVEAYYVLSNALIAKGSVKTFEPMNLVASIDNGTITDSNAVKSVDALYESVELSWNHPSEADKVLINEQEIALEDIEIVDGIATYVVNEVKTSKAEFEVALMCDEELLLKDRVVTDVYTLADVDINFEILNYGDFWRVSAGNLSGETHSFVSLTVEVYAKGSAEPICRLEYNADGNKTSVFDLWLKNRGASTIFETSRWDPWMSDFGIETFDYGTEYEIRYILGAYPTVYNADLLLPNGWIGIAKYMPQTQIKESEVVVMTMSSPEQYQDMSLKVSTADLYEKAKLSWTEVEGATQYELYINGRSSGKSFGRGVTSYTYEKLTSGQPYDFMILATGVSAYGKVEDAEIFSLINRPEPNVTFENGKLNVSGYKGGTRTDNIHEKGVLLGARVFFFKDGASNPTYTAEATYSDQGYVVDLATSIQGGRIKSNLAAALTKWHWNGASEAVATAPEMEPGTYKVRYEADYYPIINGDVSSADRVSFKSADDVLQTLITREGTEEFEVVVEEKITEMTLNVNTPQQYQALSVGWLKADGAMSYKVYVDDELKAEVADSPVTIEGLSDKRFYDNIKVEAYNVDGKVVGEGKAAKPAEVFTMCNWEEPQFSFNLQDDGTYQVVVSNLVNLNYAYAGGATIELVKDGQVVYSLWNNNTADGFLAAWASYKRWAFNAHDNRKDWKWTVNGVEEPNEVNKHAIEPGTYTIRWQWDYVLNKNGKWATGTNDGSVVSDKSAAINVYFSGGHSDVLWTTYGSVPYRMQKSGVTTVTIQ